MNPIEFTAPQVASISSAARTLLRDFPQYFEVTLPPTVRMTIRLPHPLVSDIEVMDIATGDLVDPTLYGYDARNGLLKMTNRTAYPSGLHVQGYHYEWFLPTDLDFYAHYVIHDQLFEREDHIYSFDDISSVERDVMAKGTVVLAFMSLLSEFSTEIDVSSPEGMSIPAHQRYQQVQGMYEFWSRQYASDTAMLNVGLDRISVRSVRKRSWLTNRLPPEFEDREVDDPRPPLRAFPPIQRFSPDDDAEANGDGQLGEFGLTGWETMGTGG